MQWGGNPAADKIQIKVEKQQAEAQSSLLEFIEDFVVFIKNNWAPTTIKHTNNSLTSNVIPVRL